MCSYSKHSQHHGRLQVQISIDPRPLRLQTDTGNWTSWFVVQDGTKLVQLTAFRCISSFTCSFESVCVRVCRVCRVVCVACWTGQGRAGQDRAREEKEKYCKNTKTEKEKRRGWKPWRKEHEDMERPETLGQRVKIRFIFGTTWSTMAQILAHRSQTKVCRGYKRWHRPKSTNHWQ